MTAAQLQSLTARVDRLVEIIRAINARYEHEAAAQLDRCRQRLFDAMKPTENDVVFPLTEKG